jgi:hypothetical protein
MGVPRSGVPVTQRFLKLGRYLLPVAVVAFLLMQLVPYRLTNPRARLEPKWDSTRTRELTVAACYDCHSNETKHHWYTQLAPISWWTVNHVRDGRAALNFSEWRANARHETGDIYESISGGSMPPSSYTWFGFHKAAKLTAKQRAELLAGLSNTLR